MPVTHPKFVGCAQLVAASNNSPQLKKGGAGEGVRRVQDALRSLGEAFPNSTRPDGTLDGVFGMETKTVVQMWQRKQFLTDDGEVGTLTLAKLELALPRGGPVTVPRLEDRLPYRVPGRVRRMLQSQLVSLNNPGRDTAWLCWAAGLTTMKSWRDQVDYEARSVVREMGTFFEDRYDRGDGMPWLAYGDLIRKAGMAALPPMTVPKPDEWLDLLKRHGLLWIGASENGPSYSHTYMVLGMNETVIDGQNYGVRVETIQPGSVSNHDQSLADLTDKVKAAGKPGYYQIRYYANRG